MTDQTTTNGPGDEPTTPDEQPATPGEVDPETGTDPDDIPIDNPSG